MLNAAERRKLEKDIEDYRRELARRPSAKGVLQRLEQRLADEDAARERNKAKGRWGV